MADEKIEMAGDDERFAENMRLLREGLGWSQGELARRMQEAGWQAFHQTTISRIEKGDRPVKIGEARAIAKVLGTLVGLMIAPSEQALAAQALASELQQVRLHKGNLAGNVLRFHSSREMLGFALDRVKELGLDGLSDGDMPERVANLIEQSEVALTWTPRQIVESTEDEAFGGLGEHTHILTNLRESQAAETDDDASS